MGKNIYVKKYDKWFVGGTKGGNSGRGYKR